MPILRYSGNGKTWRFVLLEHKILEMFSSENVYPISCTWLPPDLVKEAVQKLEDINNKVVFITLMDQYRKEHLPESDRIKYISSEDFIFWLLAVGEYFQIPEIEKVLPVSFENKFLCYQRKVFSSRELLFETLQNSDGLITISNKDFRNLNIGLDPECGIKEVIPDDEIPEHLMMPNDVFTLGNLEIWNKSFLNIVSETVQPLDTIFLSEKTFKPILGMRPFIHYGPPRIEKFLQDKGFETFNEDFGYVPGNSYEEQAKQIKDIVDHLNINDLNDLFKQLYPKILHNRNNFNQIVKNEWVILKNIIESEYGC